MLMIMQLVTLFVIVFSTMALSVVLKDSTMTMILSLLLFGGPLLIEWGGVPIVHYLSLNSLLDGHQILQGNWLVLISEIVIFWGALSFAAGYVSSVLMSMGMMMLPPTTISMPFKVLLFILADGWDLVIW